MVSKTLLIVASTVSLLIGCTPATPNVDVQLPSTEVGRWSIERTVKSEYGNEKFIFLDTANGTVCVLETSDISGAAVFDEMGKIKSKLCAKLPK